jgi:hypothetical protein
MFFGAQYFYNNPAVNTSETKALFDDDIETNINTTIDIQ